MPLPLMIEILSNGFSNIPYVSQMLTFSACSLAVYVAKAYFGGVKNISERNMHSKVVMITVSLRSRTTACPSRVYIDHDRVVQRALGLPSRARWQNGAPRSSFSHTIRRLTPSSSNTSRICDLRPRISSSMPSKLI